MQVILATEIYGLTESILQFANKLGNGQTPVLVLDPYDGVEKSFSTEAEAYDSFIEHCGHDGFRDLVRAAVIRCAGPVMLIGFSVGGAACWRVLEDADASKNIQHYIGFYPGQIRNFLEIEPNCPSTLIFPREEAHFSIPDLMRQLNGKDLVRCYQAEALHGFMNNLSPNFTPELADPLWELLAKTYLDTHETFCVSLGGILSVKGNERI